MSIYFARVGGYVKIGRSDNPEKRVRRIRTDDTAKPFDLDRAAPVELLRVIHGDIWEEMRVHDLLRDWMHTGEWFVAEPELLELVTRVKPKWKHRRRRARGQVAPWADPAYRIAAEAEAARLLERYRKRRLRETAKPAA